MDNLSKMVPIYQVLGPLLGEIEMAPSAKCVKYKTFRDFSDLKHYDLEFLKSLIILSKNNPTIISLQMPPSIFEQKLKDTLSDTNLENMIARVKDWQCRAANDDNSININDKKIRRDSFLSEIIEDYKGLYEAEEILNSLKKSA